MSDDELADLHYDYQDFAKVKSKEFAAKETDHTRKILENTCAPVQSIRKDRKNKNESETTYITFDESQVKLIKDLDPKQVLKFRDNKE